MKKIFAVLLSIVLLAANTTLVFAGADEQIAKIEAEIKSFVSNRSIGLYYKSLETGETYQQNASKRFPSASTLKLPIVLCAYQMVADGRLDLDSTMTYTSQYYASGTGIIRYQKVGSTYTIRQLVDYAVKHSDNIAYYMLRAKMGDGNLFSYTRSIGAAFSGEFNSVEVAHYMSAVYNFVNNNGELGQEFLSFFIDTEFEDRIPTGVPGIPVAHKIGRLTVDRVYHDAAVVYDEHPYVLVIMTQGDKNITEDVFIKLTELIQKRHRLLYGEYTVSEGALYIQETQVDIPNTYVVVETGEIMMPMGGLVGYLGAEVTWDSELECGVFDYNGKSVFVFPSHAKMYVDTQAFSSGILYKDKTTFVSSGLISEAFGINITEGK